VAAGDEGYSLRRECERRARGPVTCGRAGGRETVQGRAGGAEWPGPAAPGGGPRRGREADSKMQAASAADGGGHGGSCDE
jgi:hypothetical protein